MEEIDFSKKFLLVSVKPEFANKIIIKEKTIELRKTKPNVKVGDYIIIYASSPIKSILGFGVIKQVIVSTPQIIWENKSSYLGIDKQSFDQYFKDKQRAIGIEIESIIQVKPFTLKDLRLLEFNFHPPQIYKYISKEIFSELNCI